MPPVANHDCQATTDAGIQERSVVGYMSMIWDWDGRLETQGMQPPVQFSNCVTWLPM